MHFLTHPRMLASAGVAVLLLWAPTTPALTLGDNLEAVRAELGKPESVIEIGTRKTLYYSRGKVELVDGKVVELHLVSEEEAEARRLREEQERVRREQELRAQQAALMAEGRELRDRTLSDASFLGKSAGHRVAFWQNFAQRYPGVPLPTDYDVALSELNVERRAAQARAEEDARLRSLEQRVNDAEARAVRAEHAARRAERNYGYPYSYYSDYPTVIVPGRYNYYDYPQPLPARVPAVDPLFEPGSWKRNALGVPPVHAPKHRFDGRPSGHIRPRGYHNAQVHNRALSVRPGIEPGVGSTYFSSGTVAVYGAPNQFLSGVEQPAPLPRR